MAEDSDICLKIRSAIKAKLVELGAFADDELPDYVMVMIANKKTKKQMQDDLSLFLGENAQSFSCWIHEVLDRLQAIGNDETTKAAEKKEKGEKAKKVKKEKKEKKKPKEKKHKEKAKEPQLTVEKTSKDAKAKLAAKLALHGVEEPEEDSPPPPVEAAEKAAFVPIEQGERSKEEPVDELELQLDYDSTVFEDVDTNTSQQKHHESSAHSKFKEAQQRSRYNEVERYAPPHRRHGDHRRRERSGSSDYRSHRYEHDDRYRRSRSRDHDRRVQSSTRRRPHSRNMQARPAIFIRAVNEASRTGGTAKERFRPHHYARSRSPQRSPSLEAQRRVVHRRSSPSAREHDDRANRRVEHFSPTRSRSSSASSTCMLVYDQDDDESNVLYDADLQNELDTGRAWEAEARSKAKARLGQRLVERKKLGEETAQASKATASSPVESTDPKPIVEEPPDSPICSTEKSPSPPPLKSKPVKSSRKRRSDDLQPSRTLESSVAAIPSKPTQPSTSVADNPQFFVTLDGPELPDQKSQQPVVKKQRALIIVEENGRETRIRKVPARAQSPFLAESEQGVSLTDIDFEHVSATVYNGLNAQTQNPVTICLDDDEEDESFVYVSDGATPPQFTAQQVASATPMISPQLLYVDDQPLPQAVVLHSPNQQLQQQQLQQLQQPQQQQQQQPQPQRCRFWPVCRLADSCPFYHPTTPCKSFPACRFADRCLFIHPTCRFDARCTNPVCPYTHPSRKKAPQPQAGPPQAQTYAPPPAMAQSFAFPNTRGAINCRFGGSCRNGACQFKHPRQCVYGASCTRPGCPFTHTIALPSKVQAKLEGKKFNWVASKTTVPKEAAAAPTSSVPATAPANATTA